MKKCGALNNWHYSKTPFSRAAGRFKRELSSLGSYLLKQAASFEREVRAAAKEAIAPRGKYIRPLLVFSAAPAGAKKDSLVRRAAIAELVHLSTLIHDDVIDRADMRRNRDTAFKKYGAKTAVLLGDAIFAHMMTLAFEENSMEVLEKTASCVRSICSGEIRQTLADNTKIVPRKKYYDVAYGKTAALFELSCRLGAGCGEAPKGWEAAAAECGKQLGIAYQIYDDLCDWFMSESDAGKTLGTDLVSGKQTYPLIALLEKLPKKESEALAKNLPTQNPEKIAEMMSELDVPGDCAREFSRRVSLAEKAISKFPETRENLMRFCAEMRGLIGG